MRSFAIRINKYVLLIANIVPIFPKKNHRCTSGGYRFRIGLLSPLKAGAKQLRNQETNGGSGGCQQAALQYIAGRNALGNA